MFASVLRFNSRCLHFSVCLVFLFLGMDWDETLKLEQFSVPHPLKEVSTHTLASYYLCFFRNVQSFLTKKVANRFQMIRRLRIIVLNRQGVFLNSVT